MRLNKVKVSKEASERLKHLKARTGLAPNILSRLGFCLSLSDPSIPDPERYPEEDREFNRYTLLGEWDGLFVALLKQRLHQDQLAEDQIEEQFRAHLNRGILALYGLAKGMADIARLCEKAGNLGVDSSGSEPSSRGGKRPRSRTKKAHL